MSLLLVLVSATVFLGFAQGLSPERWFEPSYIGWRKGRNLGQIGLQVLSALGLHLALGFLIFCFLFFLGQQLNDPRFLVIASTLLVMGSFIFRFVQSSRFKYLQRAESSSPLLTGPSIWYLGPAESLAIILLKASQLETAQVLTTSIVLVICYALSLAVTVGAGVLISTSVWDRPERHNEVLSSASDPWRMLPSIVLTLFFLLAM